MSMTLKAARVNANLSREEVAKHLGVSVRSVTSWELKETIPNVVKGMKLAKLYGIEAKDIEW